jgi:hypothetical protein
VVDVGDDRDVTNLSTHAKAFSKID